MQFLWPQMLWLLLALPLLAARLSLSAGTAEEDRAALCPA